LGWDLESRRSQRQTPQWAFSTLKFTTPTLQIRAVTDVNSPPLFDFAVIFAANINYHIAEQRAILYLNPNVVRVLDNVETYFRPLYAQGVKFLLSILGNDRGAGISNFPTIEATRDSSLQLNEAVRRYGLDGNGIFFRGTHGTVSFLRFCDLISFYDIMKFTNYL